MYLITQYCIDTIYEQYQQQKILNNGLPLATSVDDEVMEHKEEIGLRLLWFHHIKNPQKKKDIVNWATELNLGGKCKPGYPVSITLKCFILYVI